MLIRYFTDGEKGNLMDYLKEAIVVDINDNMQAMSVEQAKQHLEHLENWELMYEDSRGYHLLRCLCFDDTDKAREFVAELKALCESMNMMPNIQMNGTDVSIVCYTSQLNGLHRNDFIMAAHINDLYMRWDSIMEDCDKVTQASYDSFPASDPPGY